MTASTKVRVRNYIDAAQLKKDLAFNPNNISDAMITQASLFAHYGTKAALASRQVDQFKMLLENTEAAVDRKIRDHANAKGEKMTEPQLKGSVARHERVISMKRLLNEAKQIEAVAKTAVEAFRHRRDMLIQEGFIQREEMKGELSMAIRRERDEEMEQRKREILSRRGSSENN